MLELKLLPLEFISFKARTNSTQSKLIFLKTIVFVCAKPTVHSMPTLETQIKLQNARKSCFVSALSQYQTLK